MKNLLAQNELLMLTSSDTDALLAAYSMDSRAGRKQSTSDLDSRQRRIMLKVLNVSRKGVSSKEARLQRAGEDEKVRTYEQLNKKTHQTAIGRLSSGRPISPYNKDNVYGNMTTQVALKM